MPRVIAAPLPEQSQLFAALSRASFHDSYSAPLGDETLTPLEIFQRASRATPRWVETAMAVRNAIVRRIGLKDVGAMRDHMRRPARDYSVGERLGIFTILDIQSDELLLGIDDSHLDVRVSVLKRPGRYVVSTLVVVHNWVGRLYMLPVGRIHPLVVRATMRRARV